MAPQRRPSWSPFFNAECAVAAHSRPTLGIRVAALARSVASLRIIGDGVVPEEISSLLGAEPTKAHRKGELILASGRTTKIGIWRLEAAPTEPENLDAQVAEILGKLTQNLDIWKSLSAGFRVNVFCGLFMNESNEGVELSPATLLALGERGIHLDLDIYAWRADV